MADIELVIKIPEKTINEIKDNAMFAGSISSDVRWGVTSAIVNGTPIKTGHWIDDNENEIDAQYGRHLYKCSECNKYANKFVGGTEDWWDLEKPNYCPCCGTKMQEVKE